MLCLVGSAPSSGSTFFADLMDSSCYSCCGPEFEFFSNKNLFSFNDQFKANPLKSSSIAPIRTRKQRIKDEVLAQYGLSKGSFLEMIQSSTDFGEFSSKFVHHYISYRGKKEAKIVFEKTPQNVNTIKEFLDSTDEGFFIYIIRNPINVANSLNNRNFGNYTSSAIWLVNVAIMQAYLSHPRVITVKYEDLVENPYQTAKTVLEKVLGHEVEEVGEIENKYKNNKYRRGVKRISTWTNNQYGKVKKRKEVPSYVLQNSKRMLGYKLSKGYMQKYDLGLQLSMKNALEMMGYSTAYMEKVEDISLKNKKLSRNHIDIWKMFAKGMYQIFQGNAKIAELGTFFKPIEKS